MPSNNNNNELFLIYSTTFPKHEPATGISFQSTDTLSEHARITYKTRNSFESTDSTSEHIKVYKPRISFEFSTPNILKNYIDVTKLISQEF